MPEERADPDGFLLALGGNPIKEGKFRCKMRSETGGAIWHALARKGELSLPLIQTGVKRRTASLSDWASGQLARDDKIVVTPEKHSFRSR